MRGLEEFFEQRIERGREEVSWGTMAAILTIARFCEPASELHIADTWYRRTALVREEDLKYLRGRGGRYIVGTPKAMLRQFEQHLTEQDWSEAQEGVEVKLVPGPDGEETFLLARSVDRRAKEQAMQEKFRTRLEEGLKKMQAAAVAGRLKDEAAAGERLGRLKERNWRASQAFEVSIRKLAEPRGKQRLEITWRPQAKFAEWSQHADGCYLLRSNLTDGEAATLWKRYIQLTEAEWAFRITKDELEIRPIWHQKEDRVKAHILVCFLAYVLWKTLAGWMRNAGLGDAPRTVIESLAEIKSGDVSLCARRPGGQTEQRITLRCVTEPDAALAVLLHRLGLTLPRRLRRLDNVIQM